MNLQNNFLIAMPSLEDSMFSRTVIFICEHTSNGAMGIVINQPIPDLSVKTLLSKLDIMPAANATMQTQLLLDAPVFAGGPIADDRGFILHSPHKNFSSSLTVSPEIVVTTSKDILESLGTNEHPQNMLISLGYSGWAAGQLEQEIMDNSWLVVDADNTILFQTPVELRWQMAARKLGIDIYSVATQVGHA